MGQERECTLDWQGKRYRGHAVLETDHVLFRGEIRLKFRFDDLKSVEAAAGILRLHTTGGRAMLELGASAQKWAEKILHPPTRIDKLGIKKSEQVAVVGPHEPKFIEELRAAGAEVIEGSPDKPCDWVILAVVDLRPLLHLDPLRKRLKPNGGLWIVYPKGVEVVTEADVLLHGRSAGLKDNRVMSFSKTQTALKFVVPGADRPVS